MNEQPNNDKARESKLRRLARRKGYRIAKDRVRVENQTLHHNGGYQILTIFENRIEAGENFELSLDDVEKLLNKWDADE